MIYVVTTYFIFVEQISKKFYKKCAVTGGNMSTILIIDDDMNIGDLEQEVLEGAGHKCLRAYSGTEALLLLEKETPDLILLDLMLPGLTGEEVLNRILGEKTTSTLTGTSTSASIGERNRIPVIVVSAKVGVDDKVSLLMNGADDYITKPFSNKELLARVEVQLRKAQALAEASTKARMLANAAKPTLGEGSIGSDGVASASAGIFGSDLLNTGTTQSGRIIAEIVTFDDITMNLTAHQVFVNEKLVSLTPTEFAILKLLMQNQGHVIAKSVILDRIFEDTQDCTESSLKTHISHLRSKLREAGDKEYIEAIWGIGFKMG